MNAFQSLRNIIIFSAFSLIALTSSYANDATIARGEDRGGEAHFNNQGRDINRDNLNRNDVYGSGVYGSGVYGSGAYGGAVIYPQNTYPPSNAQAFPDDAQFDNTYERNQHPPR